MIIDSGREETHAWVVLYTSFRARTRRTRLPITRALSRQVDYWEDSDSGTSKS